MHVPYPEARILTSRKMNDNQKKIHIETCRQRHIQHFRNISTYSWCKLDCTLINDDLKLKIVNKLTPPGRLGLWHVLAQTYS